MRVGFVNFGYVLGTLLLIVSMNASWANDHDQELFATGLIPISEEELAQFPQTPAYRAFIPESVDLSRFFPRPGNQGRQGSCVGWAIGYAARAYYSQAVEQRSLDNTANIPSPAFIYNAIRSPDSNNCDDGSFIQDGLDLLKRGALSMQEFPYSDRTCDRPSAAAMSRATDFRITEWRVVSSSNLDQIKGQLAQGNPVIISMRTREAFHRLRGNRTYRSNSSPSTGWHAMTVTGYDERRQAFRVINSWGTRWGDRGYAWISYDAFRKDVRGAFTFRVDAPAPSPVIIPTPVPRPQPVPSPVPAPVPIQPSDDVFSGYECAQLRVDAIGGESVAIGFVGSEEDYDRLARDLSDANIRNDVQLRPWPQCEALLTLAQPLSTEGRPEISFSAPVDEDTGDHLLVFDIRTPFLPGYLHLAYVQADGSVVHLRQSDATTLQTLPPGSRLRLGDGSAGGPKYRLSPPYGREMMIAVFSRSPLFSAPRQQMETEREFLTALRQSLLLNPLGNDAMRLITADYHALETFEGGVK